jgi:nucleoside-diphosphate-sugar epimerase
MSVHYRERDFYPTEETVPLDSPSVYGLTKGLGEEICAYFARWFGMDILGLRISGPRTRADFLAQRSAPKRAGDGSFVHPLDEEDMANAYLGAVNALGDQPRYESIYIVGDEKGVEHDLSKAQRLIGWQPRAHLLLDEAARQQTLPPRG